MLFRIFTMSIKDKIEQYLKEIQELERIVRESQDKEILPFSFFSSSIDILDCLKTGIYEIEAIQMQKMQEHFRTPESKRYESQENKEINEVKKPIEINEIRKPVESKTTEEKTAPVINVLADTIGRKINTDFVKSLTLNDRFMFQRDIFNGNSKEMNKAFTQLNQFQTLNEVLGFLNKNYTITWNSVSGVVLKELLEKRFV